MRVLLSGGGTAGHIYPALTVAEELRAGAHSEVTFIGTPEGLEARLVSDVGIPFVPLAARGFDRARPLTLVSSSLLILRSALRARRLIRSMRPSVVVGFGGYVSIPVGLAAVMTGTPLVLHEQNSVPGLANRILSRWATAVGVTYETSVERLAHPERALLTGNPVRQSVLGADAAKGRGVLGVPADATMLLVFGGSRGARHINRAVTAIAADLLAVPGTYVVHVAGRGEYDEVVARLSDSGVGSDRYRVLDYIDDMGSALAAADLIVARAGATSLAEITALGRPAILVPFPYATDDHQTTNANAVVNAGGAILLPDHELDGQRFVDECTRLLRDGSARATMAAASMRLGRPDAGSRVAQMALRAAGTDSDAPTDPEDQQ